VVVIKKKLLILLILSVIITLIFVSFVVSAQETENSGEIVNETGSISGKVIPTEAGLTVRAIQNLSLVAEMTTDEGGHYKIEGLSPGKYGLLFVRNSIVYIYNDEIQRKTNPEESIITNLKEPVTLNTVANINLNTELADYFANRFTVQFKPNISETKIEKIISSCNCSIKEKIEWSWGDTTYVLNSPYGKTVLEIVRNFNLNENIESAELAGVSFHGIQEVEDTDFVEVIARQVQEQSRNQSMNESNTTKQNNQTVNREISVLEVVIKEKDYLNLGLWPFLFAAVGLLMAAHLIVKIKKR